jgi:alpha-methylacyl-CoA racemase
VMARLGLDWEAARVLNERLIYCSISAFGQEGPRRDLPGHDLNLQALTGVCHLERDARGRPRGTVLPLADLSAAMSAAISVCAALAARGPDGPGRHLDVAMSDGVLSWSVLWSTGVDLAGPVRDSPVPQPLTRALTERLDRERLFALPHYGLFRCRDGRWLALGIVDERHFWEALCHTVGLGAFARVSLPARVLGGGPLRGMLRTIFRTRDRAAWLVRLAEAGVPVTPVLTPTEGLADPQVQARGLARGAEVRVPLPDARIPDADAPALGEHTEQVLAGLGVSMDADRD